MKKIFNILCALCASLMSFAQSNYAGSSQYAQYDQAEIHVNRRDTIYIEKLIDNSNKFYFEKNSPNLTDDISEPAKSLKESGSKEGSKKWNNGRTTFNKFTLKQALVTSGVSPLAIGLLLRKLEYLGYFSQTQSGCR